MLHIKDVTWTLIAFVRRYKGGVLRASVKDYTTTVSC